MEKTVPAFAKLNLTLDVLGKRNDGYHEMRTIMVSVDLRDTVTIAVGTGQGLRIKTNLGYIPSDDRNLAAKAAKLFQKETGIDAGGVDISVSKVIPVCAGMAGGSSDAAAVLRAMNEMLGARLLPGDLAAMSRSLGADTPYCVLGGTMLAEGIGDELTPLKDVPKLDIVVCKPRFSTSTPAAFAALDRAKIKNHPDTVGMIEAIEQGSVTGIATRLYNVFEEPQAAVHRELGEIRSALINSGAVGASLTGSGSAMFGVYASEDRAKRAARQLRESYRDVFVTKTV